jgi:hypothetical protein
MQSIPLTEIPLESEKVTTPEQNLALMRVAVERFQSQVIRPRLANMLLMQEAFDDIIAMFATI